MKRIPGNTLTGALFCYSSLASIYLTRQPNLRNSRKSDECRVLDTMGRKGDPFSQDGWAMRAEEARRMLGGIGRNTFYDWVNKGLIPHKRLGRVLLFSRRKLQEWLESGDNDEGA